MSTSLEVNESPDDWLDVTTKEEILQNELVKLKEVLVNREKEIEASNLLVEELKKDRESLRGELDQSKDVLVKTETLLGETLASKNTAENEQTVVCHALKKEVSLMKKTADESRDHALRLECKIKDIQRLNEKESKEKQLSIETLENTNTALKEKLHVAEGAIEIQKNVLNKTRAELKESNSELLKAKKDLADEKKTSGATAKQLETANKSIGTLAILAEDRKDERHSLQRSVTQQKHALGNADKDLEQSNEVISTLKEQLADVRNLTEKTIKELQEANVAYESELVVAKNEIKEQKSQLDSKIKELEGAEKEIEQLQQAVEDIEIRRSTLSVELEETQASEKELKAEIEAQKAKHERRLECIREALGVTKGDTRPFQPFDLMKIPIPTAGIKLKMLSL